MKKVGKILLSILGILYVAVAVFLTAFYGLTPVISFAEGEASQEPIIVGTWDGNKSYDYTQMEGEGTEANPYKIYNGAQLYAAVNTTVEKWFVIMNDIVLQPDVNDAATVAGLEEPDANLKNWANNDQKSFIGHIDGNFKTISGLYTNFVARVEAPESGCGFIDQVAGTASIQNLTIDGAYMQANTYLGGIVGKVMGGNPVIGGCAVINSTLTNNYVPTGNSTNDSGKYAVGGIAGCGYGGKSTTITNCAVYNATLDNLHDTNDRLGGFLGDFWAAKANLTNCFVVGYKVYNSSNSGGIGTCTNVYTTEEGTKVATPTVISSDKIKGSVAYDEMKLSPAKGWIIKDENSYPLYVGAENISKHNYPAPIWHGVNTLTYANLVGSGTELDPYLVSTGGELYAAVVCTAEKWFKVVSDIQLQSDANMQHLEALVKDGTELPDSVTLNNWWTNKSSSSNDFIGHFDGNFKTITGLYLNNNTITTSAGVGLINRINSTASVKNTIIDGAYLTAQTVLGAVVGRVKSANISIDGCTVKNSKLVNTHGSSPNDGQTAVAAIAGGGGGNITATISNCAAYNNSLSNNQAARLNAIYGDAWTTGDSRFPTLINCVADGNLKPINNAASVVAVYTTGTAFTATDGTATIKISNEQLTSGNLNVLNRLSPDTGWKLVEGNYPEYTGVKGEFTVVPWDGTTALSYKSLPGSGTAEDPYQIRFGSELYAAVTCTDGSYFKLMNDIQLQSNANMDELKKLIAGNETTATFNSWRYSATASKLNLDGNFKTITGLYLNEPTVKSSAGLGLISVLNGGCSISNLTMEYEYISGVDKIGGIVGFQYKGSGGTLFYNCVLKNSKLHNVSTSTDDQYCTVGGIAAGHWSGGLLTFENCAVYDSELISNVGTAKNYVGGIFGSETWTSGQTIKNCISVGYSPNATSANSYVTCTSTYTTANISKAGVTANISKEALKGSMFATINPTTGWIITENEYPKFVGVGNINHPVNTTVTWDGFKGFTDVTLLEGEGTSADDPKLIYYPYELYAAVNCTTETYFRLMNNFQLQTTENMEELESLIDNDDSTNPTEGTTFNDWGKHKVVFKGHIDGNFKTVSGLYINNNVVEAEYGLGFISRAAGPASIDNLTLDQTYVTGKVQIGGFVGLMYGTEDELKISGCVLKNSKLHNTSTVEDVPEGKTGDAQYYGVAGIIAGGWNGSQTIKNTAVYDNTFISDRGNFAYGFVGPNNGKPLTATNCIVEGYVPRNSDQAYNNVCTTASVTNSGAVVVTKEQLKSGDVLPGIRPLTGWELTEGEYPKYTGVKGEEITNGVSYWNGITSNALDEIEGNGDGSEGNPILIRHGFELYAAIQNTDSNKHFKLVNDIYLNDINLAPSKWTNPWAVWRGGKTFSGTLDGDGHTVYGLYEPSYDGSAVNTYSSKVGVGLIPSADNATIKNLHLRNVNMLNCWNGYQGGKGSGGFVGVAGTVTIDGCSISGDGVVNRHMGNAGGFIGQVTTSATVTNSVYSGGTVKAESGYYAGSIIGDVGTATVTLTDVVANGYVFLGNGTATETNTFLVNVPSVGYSPAGVKYVLRSGEKSLSDAFYYDFLSENLPQLKNRKATQNVDIDGNAGTTRDTNDALALKNILLYGGANQVNATDKTNYYNEVEGLDIADLVYVYVNAQ